jgi:hypothetical protein
MRRRYQHDNSGMTVLVIVGSIVGSLLVLILACGGLTAWMIYRASEDMAPQLQAQGEWMGASGAAQTFLNQLAAGQINDAYNGTTAAFRNRQTLAQFQAFLQRNPLLTRGADIQEDPVNNPPGARQMTLHYTLTTADNKITKVTVQVVLENGEWKVDSVTSP